MITIPELVAQALGSFLSAETRARFGGSQGAFGASQGALADFLPSAAKLALECIGNSDALYHNIEHSMLVTLVGHDILIGRALQRSMTAGDYANFILACLTHDIGYVRGVVHGDDGACFVADVTGRTVRLPAGASDAALAPYHVDRSKLFVVERLDGVEGLDVTRIAKAIEYTGMNKTLGYDTPADIIYKYPQFYWKHVAPQVQGAISHLNVTSSGRQWIANLYSNVFRAEREVGLSGPQMPLPR